MYASFPANSTHSISAAFCDDFIAGTTQHSSNSVTIKISGQAAFFFFFALVLSVHFLVLQDMKACPLLSLLLTKCAASNGVLHILFGGSGNC